jgi:hypothetical protein
LAHEVLGARLDERVMPSTAPSVPSWLVPAMFRQWHVGRGHIGTSPAAALVRHPTALWKALRLRWPNPIQATVTLRGPFNELPRLPFQIGECLIRTASFVTRREHQGAS